MGYKHHLQSKPVDMEQREILKVQNVALLEIPLKLTT
ncbi:MAG: hypothetical protein JWQ34_2562 [Mucilaginibacter sp.]|nr:hypothetical protein [Mucilaginibacter sp.]